MRRLWHGLAGGLLAGSAVGLAEAVWVLSQASTGEYLALLHAALLYGLLGGGLGLAVGAALALVGLAWRGLTDPLSYTLSCTAVAASLGGVVLAESIDRTVYLDLGLGPGGQAAVAVVLATGTSLALWLGPVFLTRTPLKILLLPRGTLAAWAAVLGLSALFAASPGEHDQGRAMVPGRTTPPQRGESPDVLIITVESLRADTWDGGGLPLLSNQAVRFTQHIVPSSWTRPSVASLLTSQLPAAHGLDVVTARLEPDRVTLPEVLREWGYATAAIPARADLERAHGLDQGFDWLVSMDEPRGLLRSESGRRLLLGGWLRAGARAARGGGIRVEDLHRPAPEVLAQVRRFIQANREAGNRYLVWAHLAEPSLPWFDAPGATWVEEPARGAAEDARAAYRAEVQRVDAAIGELVEWLVDERAWEDLLVVVVGVHGEELLDHGGWGHGQTLYDEAIHTPLVIKRPGRFASPGVVEAQVRLIDIAPTIVEAIGAEQPPPWEGRPLFSPEIEDDSEGIAAGPTDRPAVAQLHLGGAVVEALRLDGWKLVRANAGNPRRMPDVGIYDLGQDPAESRNLAGQVGPAQAELSRALRELLAASGSWRTRPPVPGP